MALLNQFKLGRPAYESLFTLNPSAITYTPTRMEDMAHGLDGSGISVNLSRNRPVCQINGDYITADQRNQFLSLLHIDYEPLVFEPRDFTGNDVWESWQERVIPINAKQFYIPSTSFTEAAKWKQLNGGGWTIVPVGLWEDMNRTHGRMQPVGPNKIIPGVWGQILLEDFNLLPTGLLENAGKNWWSVNGNGTTRDCWVSDVSPIEGAKSLLITSDGSGTPCIASRANGGLWGRYSLYGQRGYDVEKHTATWQAQLVGTTLNNHLTVYPSTWVAGPVPWTFEIDVTSGPAATYEFWVNGVQVVAPTALSNPFLPHAYTVIYDGTNITAKVDTTVIYGPVAVTLPVFNTLNWSAVGWATEDVCLVDTINVYDGDGFDPSTGLFSIVEGTTNLTVGKPYWFTYQYNAMTVEMDAIPLRAEGGWVGFERYNFTLVGV